ncbi:MAG TPA: cytochrome D1 domain-containing protein [Pyrinomonadaceae bacterium]|jgi:YVTN family beta-propeller protein
MRSISRTLLACALASSFAAQSAAAAPAQEKAPAAAPQAPPAQATTPAPKPPAPSGPQKLVTQGLEVEFTIEPVKPADAGGAGLTEAQDARVRVRVTDTATRSPLAGVRPSIWMTQRQGERATTEQCKEKIKSFLQGSLRARPDVDLNSYYVLALNSEPNISVIDPLLGFGGTKLVTLVMLNSPGEDWAITADQERLFVSMPSSNQVAVVDTNTWKVVANVETGARPVRLALQPDEKYLWVGTDEGAESGVTVIDAATFKQVARIPTGAGHHELALSGDSRTAFVTNEAAGTLSLIDVTKLAKTADVKTGRGSNSVAVSPLSKFVYVSDRTAGQVAVVDPAKAAVLASITAAPGLGAVRFAPGGRYGFAPNPAAGVVHIFDASTNRLLHDLKVSKGKDVAGRGPDQVAFTKEFAYVRSAGSLDVTMVRLSTIGKEMDVVTFPAGQAAPADARTEAAAGGSLAPAPEGNSMLVANVADRQIYYYTEGMAAPMGDFQNYKREPRAVLIADRSLREVKSGTYETVTKLPRGGAYDVAFLLDSPRVTHCFDARAAENPDVQHERPVALAVEYLDRERTLPVGEDFKLRLRLTDKATGKPADGLKDVRVLTFLSPGVWQKRDFARGVGAGVYELNVNVPAAGLYMIFVESRSAGVAFRQLPYLMLRAAAPAAAKAPAPGRE